MSPGDQSKAPSTTSQPDSDDDSSPSQPPTGVEGAATSGDDMGGATPAPVDTPSDAAADPPNNASTDPPEGSSDQSADASTDGASSDSTKDDSDDCAEIPCAAHAVLTANISFVLEFPHSADDAKPFPHKFTMASDDGSFSQTLSLGTDAQPGDTEGTSILTFQNLVEHHSYTLQCDNGNATYTLFEHMPYEDLQNIGMDGQVSTDEASSGPDAGTGSEDPAQAADRS